MLHEYIPAGTEKIDLTEEDATFPRQIHAIRPNVTGTFYATMRGTGYRPEAPRPYTVTVVGQVVCGAFVQVHREGTDAAFLNDAALVGLVLEE